MPSSKPLLVVCGATGKQGGSVISYFLSLSPSPYALRGITRDPSSAKSVSLTSLGVEMVAGDYDDPASLDAAFQGASVIFTVTDFWLSYHSPAIQQKAAATGQIVMVLSRENEAQQNKNMIDAAAKISTLERLVYSGIPNTEKWSGGKYRHTYHFDGKAWGEEYGESTYPELWKKTNVFYAGLYLENYLGPLGHIFAPNYTQGKQGLTLSMAEPLATTLFPMYSAVDDTGAFVHALLRSGERLIGKKLTGVKKWLSFRDVAKIVAQVLGKEIEFINVSPEFEFGPPDIQEDHMSMVGFCIEFGYDAHTVDKSVVQPSDLGVSLELESVKDWCAKQDWEKLLKEAE